MLAWLFVVCHSLAGLTLGVRKIYPPIIFFRRTLLSAAKMLGNI